MAKSVVRSRPAAAQGREASGDDVAALKKRIAELEAAAGARGPDPNAAPKAAYPKAKFRKHAITSKWPHGYEVRRVNSPEEEATLVQGQKGWVDSPDELG